MRLSPLLALVLVGCGGGNSTDLSAVRFTSQGEGDTNQAPLEFLNHGTQRVGLSGGLPDDFAQVVGTETINGKPVSVYRANGNPVALQQSELGLMLLGSVSDGIFPKPVLHVPKTVRVGMTWEIWFDDKAPALKYQVNSFEPARKTPWGPCGRFVNETTSLET